jgi:hypothetical protein
MTAISAVGYELVRDKYSSDYLCTTVTIENDSKESQTFNVWDWKMQDPSGTARNSSFTGTENQLNSGEAAGGGTTVGNVCFDNPQGSPSGTYVVLFDPARRIGLSVCGSGRFFTVVRQDMLDVVHDILDARNWLGVRCLGGVGRP